MQTITDESFGVIPFFHDGDSWKVFLIHQHGSTGDTFWTFPKGHPEEGESPREAAVRELTEETGLDLAQLREEDVFVQSYTFTHEAAHIEKSVTYFLGIAAKKDFTIQLGEVNDAGWFTLEAASEQLTHDSAREILHQAVTTLLNQHDT